MKDKRSDIDHLLQQVLDDFELDAPGIDWNAFQDKRKKKKRALFWWLSAAVIAIALLIGYSGYYNRAVSVKPTLSAAPSDNNADIPDYAETSAPSKDITQTTAAPKFKKARRNERPDNPPVAADYTGSVLIPDVSDDAPLDQMILKHEQTVNEDAAERYSSLKKLRPYHSVFNLPVYFAHPKLKVNPSGKNLFEISASAFAYSNNFRVSELGKAFIHKDYEAIRQKSEHPDGGFDLRLAFGRKLGRNEFMLGFSYSQRKISGSYDFDYSEKPLIDADGHIIGYDVNTPKHVQYTSKQTLTFVEVPILFRRELKVLQNGHRIRLNIGFVPQFLKGISGSLPNAQFLDLKENLSTENFRNTVIGGELGLSYLMPVTKGVYLNLQPYYTYNSGFKQVQSYYFNRFNYFGLRAGLQMRL